MSQQPGQESGQYGRQHGQQQYDTGQQMGGQSTGSQQMSQPTGGQQTGQPMGGQSMGQPMGGQQTGQPMGGQSMGQSMGGQSMGQSMGGQQMTHATPPRFEDHLTNELRIALEDLNEVTHVAEWCAKECAYAGPQLADCVRVCEDIAELAELNEKLIARDSMFGPEVANLFVRVASEGLPELERHQQQHPHVTETISAIDRAIDSCQTVLGTVGGAGGTMQGSQEMGAQGTSTSY